MKFRVIKEGIAEVIAIIISGIVVGFICAIFLYAVTISALGIFAKYLKTHPDFTVSAFCKAYEK